MNLPPDLIGLPAEVLADIERIISDMGVAGPLSGRALIQLANATEPPVLSLGAQFQDFMSRFCGQRRCLPYQPTEIADRTVDQFCELYVSESFPSPPAERLGAAAFVAGHPPAPARAVFEPQGFPICFVLGVARSGTTLLRSILNLHPELWAPGELHLAQYDTMGERAAREGSFLRAAFVPEAAERMGESRQAFRQRLEAWEGDRLPVPQVYRLLHEADPHAVVVDKTPPYSKQLRDLRWIARHFPGARFIHLVRNPHDVIRSFVRMQLYKLDREAMAAGRNPYHIAEMAWFEHNANIAALFSGLPERQKLVIRFEDLVDQPSPSLRAACELLEVKFEEQLARPYDSSTRRSLARGAGDPTVNQFTEIQRRLPLEPDHQLGEPCQELAHTLGY